jgi:predicted dehydrogenase
VRDHAPLRACIVGAGHQAYYHAKACQKTPGVTLVACCDVDEVRARSFAEDHKIAPFTSIAAAQREEAIDLWVVATPPFAHVGNVLDILDGPQPPAAILCEKPPALTLDELEKMAAAAEEHDVLLTYGLHLRHTAVSWLRTLADEGFFGQIYRIDTQWMRRNGIPHRGVFTDRKASGGGVGMDLLPHLLDLALYLYGHPACSSITATAHERVAAAGGTFGTVNPEHVTIEDAIEGTIQVESTGAPRTISFATSWDGHIARDRVSLEVLGTHGGARLDLVQDGQRELIVPSAYTILAGQTVNIVPAGDPGFPTVGECYALQLKTLLDAVAARRDGEPMPRALVTPDQAHTVLAGVLLAYASAFDHTAAPAPAERSMA